MQVMTRRLIVIAAIAVAGGAAGITLGNFAAGGQKRSGLEELAAYNQMFEDSSNGTEVRDTDGPSFDARSGPMGYQCEGCDARLYNDTMVGDGADTTPLPPYQPEEGVAVPPPPPPPSRVGPPANVVPQRPMPLVADQPRAPAPPPQGQD